MFKQNKTLVMMMLLLALILAGSYALFARQDTAPESVAMSGTVTFTTKDLKGISVDDTLFKDYKLTMVNVWGTFCGPCIDELPELEKAHQALKSEGIQVMGIVGDITPEGKDREALIKEANALISNAGVTYVNILPDQLLTNGPLKNLQAYPTTFFVDDKGQIVGDVIVGAQTQALYELKAEKILEKQK